MPRAQVLTLLESSYKASGTSECVDPAPTSIENSADKDFKLVGDIEQSPRCYALDLIPVTLTDFT